MRDGFVQCGVARGGRPTVVRHGSLAPLVFVAVVSPVRGGRSSVVAARGRGESSEDLERRGMGAMITLPNRCTRSGRG